MQSVYLKHVSSQAIRLAGHTPWNVHVYAHGPDDQHLTQDQIAVRDVVEEAANITTRASMCDYLDNQRSYPLFNLLARDPWLHRFIHEDLRSKKVARLSWDQLAHYSASLPFKYMRAALRGCIPSHGRGHKLVDCTLAAMSMFSLKTVFRCYAVMGLYFFQEFDPSLCMAFEDNNPVPMASALSGLARQHVKKSRFELLAAAMMTVSGDCYLAAAGRERDDPLMRRTYMADAAQSFNTAAFLTLFSKDNAHLFSPEIINVMQRYAAFRRSAIVKWQDRNKAT